MRSAFALLALAQLAIGAAAIFARFALGGGGPIAVSALRLLIAAVPIALLCALRGEYRSYTAAGEWRLAAAGAALALHFALWIASLQYCAVGISTLLVCTTPIWTETFAIARARRVRRMSLLSIGLALAGIAIVVGVPVGAASPRGMALALGGAGAIALYLILVRSSDPRYGTLAIVGRTYPIAALCLSAATAALHDRIPPSTDVRAWGGVVAMALVSQLFGHTALNAALRRLSATLVATVTLIEPALAAALAALVFAERLTPATLAGAAVILGGIAVALYAEPPPNRTPLLGE